MLSIKSRLGWSGVCSPLVMSKKRECRQVVMGSDKSGWRGECVLSRFSHVQLFCNPMDYSPPGSSVHRDSSGKNTGVGGYPFLQMIVPKQGSNSCLLSLLHWQVGSLPSLITDQHGKYNNNENFKFCENYQSMTETQNEQTLLEKIAQIYFLNTELPQTFNL